MNLNNFALFVEVHLNNPARRDTVLATVEKIGSTFGLYDLYLLDNLGFYKTIQARINNEIPNKYSLIKPFDINNLGRELRSALGKIGHEVVDIRPSEGGFIWITFNPYELVSPQELPRYGYHITNKNKLPGILQNGILPGTDTRSGEAYPFHTLDKIFLCITSPSVCWDAWSRSGIAGDINPQNKVLLQIDLTLIPTKKFYKSPHGRSKNILFFGSKIPPQAIQVIDTSSISSGPSDYKDRWTSSYKNR